MVGYEERKMGLKLTAIQKEVMKLWMDGDENPYILIAGSVTAGKSVVASVALSLHQSMYNPDGGGKYFLGAYTIGSAFNNLAPIFKELSDYYGWKYAESRSAVDPKLVINGNDFLIFGAHNVRSQNRIQGLTANAGMFDELGLMDEGFYHQGMNRARRRHMKVIMTMNKQSPVHWSKDLYDNAESQGIKLVEMNIEDNRENLPEGYIEKLSATKTGHWYQWHIANKWAVPEGLIFPDRTVREPQGRPTGNRVVVIDWGLEGVTAALLFVERAQGTLTHWHITDEYYHDGRKQGTLLERNHMNRINARFQVNPNEPVIIDPSARSLIKEYQDNGYWVMNANNNVDEGLETTGRALREELITIDPNCPNLLEEMSSYAFNPTTGKPIKQEDHACDCMRYGTMYTNPLYEVTSMLAEDLGF